MIEKFNLGPAYDFGHFFELSSDLLCIAGFDGYFKRINPAVSKLLEYTNDELYAKSINDFVHPEDVIMTSKARDGILKNSPLLNFENRYVTKSGKIVWLSWTSIPNYENQLVFAIAKNITDKKQQEQERNSFLVSLANDNKDLKQFTYTTAHDLRSPVNNLKTVFDFLDFSKIKDKKTLELLGVLKLASENLHETLNKTVDVLIQKEILSIEIEELNFKDILDEVLNSISSLIVNSNAAINSTFLDIEHVKFNRIYLKSIFLNLITNSIKYKKPDCSPNIFISTKKNNGACQLIISDNGLGFDMNLVKDKVFGLHQKFHNHIDSKGIGLYLVYNHITSIGGTISVESNVNEGTTFTLTFKN